MKSKRLFHAVLLSVFAWLFLMAGIAGAVTLTAGTAKLDLTPATAFANGESFYLLIKVSDATGVAGAALTVEYDPALFEVDETNVSGNDYFIATSNTFVTVTDTRTPPGTPSSAIPSLGNQTTSGKVMLSGAFINLNAETGGGGAYTGEQILFKVKFRAKAVGGPAVFTVKQSMLQNPAAGWGTVETAEAAPVLVGALPKTHADWANLALAFPVLLGDATHTFEPIQATGITVTAGIPISGTVTYMGKQEGTLNVGAFTDAAFQNFVGQGFEGTGAWPGTSQAYTVYVPTAGTYYLAGFNMSGAAHEDPSATDAFGTYGSALEISAAADGKNFTLIDPDVNQNNLPDWWEAKYVIYSETTPVGQNADQDNDGYSNLVEYQSYVSAADPGQNPTVPDAPGKPGYDAATDTRDYTISGTIYYSGTQVGTLNVATYAPTDTTFQTPKSLVDQKAWSGTSMTYTLTVKNGTYVVLAYIDVGGSSPGLEASEPQKASTQFSVSGANVTGRNLTLTDATTKTQRVFSANPNPSARAGGTFSLDLRYNTSDGDKTLTGIGVRVHFDSSKLTYASNNGLFATGNQGGVQIQNDTSDYDGDAATDKFALIAWVDMGGLWPGDSQTLPLSLVNLVFTANAGLSEGATSTIRFTSSSKAAGYQFDSEPATFTVRAFNLDVDGNTMPDALTDGLLIIRSLFGFTGDSLIGGAVGDGATRTTGTDIEAYLAGAGSALDVDGNAVPDALTDGLLIIRNLFGFTGDSLIGGAVGDGATRQTAEAIETHIQSLMP